MNRSMFQSIKNFPQKGIATRKILNCISKFLLFLLFTAILSSCKYSSRPSEIFTISGHLEGCSGSTLVLSEMDIHATIPEDSSKVGPSGDFRLTHKAINPGFYLLRFPGRKKLFLLLNKGETIDITGDCSKPAEEFTLKGSPGSLLLSDFFRTTNKNRRSVDSLKTLLHQEEGRADFMEKSQEADAIFQQIAMNQRKTEIDFLRKNPTSLACLIVLNYSFGPRPILDIDQDFNYYQQVDSCLQLVYSSNKHVIYHHQRILEKKRQESVKGILAKPAGRK